MNTHLGWDELLVFWIGFFTILAWIVSSTWQQKGNFLFMFLLFVGAPLLVWGAVHILVG